MLKFIGNALISAGKKIEAADTQALRTEASARAGKVVTASAKGVLATTQFIGGIAERYADPAAREARKIEEARKLLASVDAK